MTAALLLVAAAAALAVLAPRRAPRLAVAWLAPAGVLSAARHAGVDAAAETLAVRQARRASLTGTVAALLGAPAGLRMALVLGVAGVAYGVVAFRRDLASSAARRRAAIERTLPDALDLLASAADAGAPLDAAVAVVAERCGGPLRDELMACSRRLAGSGPRRHAFLALQSSGVPDLARIGAALATADELGAPLAVLLREQAALQRELRRLRVRERAAQATPKIALVVSFLLVPAGLLVMLGAQVLQMLDNGASP